MPERVFRASIGLNFGMLNSFTLPIKMGFYTNLPPRRHHSCSNNRGNGYFGSSYSGYMPHMLDTRLYFNYWRDVKVTFIRKPEKHTPQKIPFDQP